MTDAGNNRRARQFGAMQKEQQRNRCHGEYIENGDGAAGARQYDGQCDHAKQCQREVVEQDAKVVHAAWANGERGRGL